MLDLSARRNRGPKVRTRPSTAPAQVRRDSIALYLRRLGVALICAKAFLVPVFFDPNALVAFAHPKALLSHGIAALLAGVLVALVLREGAPLPRPALPDLLVLSVGAAYTLATLTALDQRLAVFGAQDRALGLATLLDQIALYLGIRLIIRGRAEVAAMGASVAVAALVVIAYEAIQKAGRDPLTWTTDVGSVSPSSTLGNADALGLFLITVASVALAVAIAPDASGWIGARIRTIALAFGAVCVVGALLTGTRAVVIGLGTAAVMIGLASVVLAPSSRARRVSGVIATGATAVLALAIFATPVGRSFQSAVASAVAVMAGGSTVAEGSVVGRLDIYRVALAELAERPILGVGPDNFVAAYPRHRRVGPLAVHESEAPQTSPHSWVLKLATDSGVAGVAAMAAALGATVVHVGRTRRGAVPLAATVGVVVVLVTGAISINDVGTDWLLWAGLALAVGPVRATAIRHPDAKRGAPRSARVPVWAIAPVLVLGLVGAVMPKAAFDALHAAADARQLRSAGKAPQAVSAASQAVKRDGGRAEYWQELGLAQVDVGDMRAAAEAFGQAVVLAPYQSTYLSNLARAYVALAQQGDRAALDKALRAADRAVAADPNSSVVHITRALAVLNDGRPSEALAEIDRARSLDPELPFLAYQTKARAHLALGQAVEAIRAVDDGLIRGRDQDLGMVLIRVQADLALGRRADAANDIVRARRFDRSDAIVRYLQRSFVAADVEGVLSAESFQGIPAWLANGKDPVGRIAGNVFTASKPSWRVVAVPIPTGDVRISVQFRFPGPQRESDEYFFEMGRVSETEPAVSLAQFRSGPFTRIMRTVGAETSVLASGAWAGTKTNTWYWIELEFRGSQVTGTLYESGAQPQPKVSAQVLGAVSADLGFAPRSGSFFFSGRSDPGVQIGGIPSATGGFYVERLKPSAQ